MSKNTLTRRQFLATGAGLGAATLLPGLASAEPPARSEHVPSHATITYDEDMLLTYRPRLVFSEDEYDKFLNLYGWVATSTELEPDVCVYWAEYTHQKGVSDYDSHDGDHEPIYVFVDDDSGEVERVDYSAYHWLRGTTLKKTTRVDGTNPVLRVDANYHHYYPVTGEDEFTNEPEVVDLGKRVDGWIANDWPVNQETIHTPWSIKNEESWWSDGKYGLGTTEEIVETRRAITGNDGFSFDFDIPFF